MKDEKGAGGSQTLGTLAEVHVENTVSRSEGVDEEKMLRPLASSKPVATHFNTFPLPLQNKNEKNNI